MASYLIPNIHHLWTTCLSFQLRDQNTGVYSHFGFAQRVGEEPAGEALRQSHWQCFSEWLAFSLEGQKADLDLYLSGIDSDRKTILETWTRTKPYRNLIPARRRKSSAGSTIQTSRLCSNCSLSCTASFPEIQTHSDSGNLADDLDIFGERVRPPAEHIEAGCG